MFQFDDQIFETQAMDSSYTSEGLKIVCHILCNSSTSIEEYKWIQVNTCLIGLNQWANFELMKFWCFFFEGRKELVFGLRLISQLWKAVEVSPFFCVLKRACNKNQVIQSDLFIPYLEVT